VGLTWFPCPVADSRRQPGCDSCCHSWRRLLGAVGRRHLLRDELRRPCGGAINQVVDRVTRNFGGFVASGLSAFQRASAGLGGDTFLAGLLIPGDIHPTAVGQTLLAQTVVDTILSTCQAAIATGCLNRNP
jgi:hypothetical protein